MLSKPKPRFVFTLIENYAITTRTGIIGFNTDICEDHLREGELLIGVSLRQSIFGPFRQVGDPFVSYEDLGFVRLYQGYDWWGDWSSSTVSIICPFRYRVEPVYPDFGVQKGLSWEVAARVAGIEPSAWLELRKEKITDQQFEALVKALLLANLEGSPVPSTSVKELCSL